jgi:hypothetical protein
MCAFFDPDNIPLGLLEKYSRDGQVPGPKDDIYKAVWNARDLHLLEHDAPSSTISLHRVVRHVLRDLLAEEQAEEALRQQAMTTLERALSDSRLARWLHPHVETTKEGPQIEKYPLLREYLEDLGVMNALEAGDSWEKLVFGGESPSYEAMHRLEDDDGRTKVILRMAAISRVCSEEFARVVFACVYFVVHYWWDNYLAGDHIADPLLEIWEQTHDSEVDKKLLETLHRIQEKYPPVQHYKERTNEKRIEMVSRWNEVGRAVQEVREQLNIALAPKEPATPATRYARGITNIYLAEALRYGKGLKEYSHPDNDQIPPLYREAEELFGRNSDHFHQIWAKWETADFRLEAGQRCRRYAEENPRTKKEYGDKATEHFEEADKKCRDGLRHAIERGRDDEIDAEVIANFYSTMASLEWETSRQASRIIGYRWAAPYVAYAYVLSEKDVYSVSFYEEHVERTMDWLLEVIDSAPDEAVPLCQFFRKCWGRPALAEGTLRSLFSRQDWDSLRDYLFPTAPELTPTSTTYNADLTDGSREEVMRHVRAMPRRIGQLRQHPLPETFTEVARLLKKQLVDDSGEENGGAE